MQALSLIALYQETGREKKQTIRKVRCFTRLLQKRALQNLTYCSGKLFLLQGELAKLQGQHRLAEFHFVSAIKCATKMDAALFHERFGRFLLPAWADEAHIQFDNAKQAYSDWGAAAKVRHLEKEKERLFVR